MAGLLGSLESSEADGAWAGVGELVSTLLEKVTVAAALPDSEADEPEPAEEEPDPPVKEAWARCLSLEILRGRGAALRAPLPISAPWIPARPGSGRDAGAGAGGDARGLTTPEPKPVLVLPGCWSPCWCGRWWHAVRRRPHWLHRARGSPPTPPCPPSSPMPMPVLSNARLAPCVLPTVASRLALTIVVVTGGFGDCARCCVSADGVNAVVVVGDRNVFEFELDVPPMTTSIVAAAAALAADAAALAADAAAFAAAAAALEDLVDTDTAPPLAEPVILFLSRSQQQPSSPRQACVVVPHRGDWSSSRVRRMHTWCGACGAGVGGLVLCTGFLMVLLVALLLGGGVLLAGCVRLGGLVPGGLAAGACARWPLGAFHGQNLGQKKTRDPVGESRSQEGPSVSPVSALLPFSLVMLLPVVWIPHSFCSPSCFPCRPRDRVSVCVLLFLLRRRQGSGRPREGTG